MNVGNVEKYRTGDGWRYRVRWSLPDGVRRSKSFKLRRDADAKLRQIEADRMSGIVHDPRRSKETLAEYAPRWLSTRITKNGRPLAPRTVELYEGQLRNHLLPRFGGASLGSITVEQVRAWRSEIGRTVGEVTGAKCYRLLHAIMHTAEQDGLIPRTPCRVDGATVERSPERPLMTVEQVVQVADAIQPRYRAMVLLAAFGGLRRGELLALRRRHLDELHNTVRVEGQAQRLKGLGRVVREPKSLAGVRTVAVPAAVMAEVVTHAAEYCAASPDAWLFVGEKGEPVREADLYAAWIAACVRCGYVERSDTVKAPGGSEGDASEEKVRPLYRFHDLRHFAGTAAARAGYTGRELQARLGHSTSRAAALYQHAAEGRDRELAEKVGAGFVAIQATRAAEVTPIRAV